jgi:hypothetical protein
MITLTTGDVIDLMTPVDIETVEAYRLYIRQVLEKVESRKPKAGRPPKPHYSVKLGKQLILEGLISAEDNVSVVDADTLKTEKGSNFQTVDGSNITEYTQPSDLINTNN